MAGRAELQPTFLRTHIPLSPSLRDMGLGELPGVVPDALPILSQNLGLSSPCAPADTLAPPAILNPGCEGHSLMTQGCSF